MENKTTKQRIDNGSIKERVIVLLSAGLIASLLFGLIFGIACSLIDELVFNLLDILFFTLFCMLICVIISIANTGILIESLIYGLAHGLVIGLYFGLSLLFIIQLIVFFTSNPEFVMFDLVVSGILVIIFQAVGWYYVWKLGREKRNDN